MKKAFVLGVLAIFAISICNVNAQNRTATTQQKGVKVEQTKKAEPKVNPNTNDTPKDVKVTQEKKGNVSTGKAVDPKTPVSTPNNKPEKQEGKTTKKDSNVAPNTNTTPKDVKVTQEKKDTPAKPKITKDTKTTAPEKTTAPAKTTGNDRTATTQQKKDVNSLKKPIGKEKAATQQTTPKKDTPTAEKDNTQKNKTNINNSVPPKPKNDKQQGTAKDNNKDIK